MPPDVAEDANDFADFVIGRKRKVPTDNTQEKARDQK